jgi:hypothetical protein
MQVCRLCLERSGTLERLQKGNFPPTKRKRKNSTFSFLSPPPLPLFLSFSAQASAVDGGAVGGREANFGISVYAVNPTLFAKEVHEALKVLRVGLGKVN